MRKTDLRIETYGTVDELNAAIGVAACEAEGRLLVELRQLQRELFILGADLSTPQDHKMIRIEERHVLRLDSENDRIEAALPQLKRFILPGGTRIAAALHHARTVSRRAERLAWALFEREPVNEHALVYLNRLSDYLFLLARRANLDAKVADVEMEHEKP